MRFPFLSLFVTSPFDGLQEHAEKVKECAWAFQQAIECFVAERCQSFEDFRQEITKIEHEADAIKRRIRGHLPKGTLLPVDKYQIFSYIKEQDHVLDAVQDTLDWISFSPESRIPGELEKDLLLLTDAVIQPIEELSKMMTEARKYFRNFSEQQRRLVKSIIRTLRGYEHESDGLEHALKKKIFTVVEDPKTVFHLIRLIEYLGSIADYAENTGDMMRAMLAK